MEDKKLYEILSDSSDKRMKGRKTFMVIALFEDEGRPGCGIHIVDDQISVPCTNKDLTVIQSAAFESVQGVIDLLQKQLVKASLMNSLMKKYLDPKQEIDDLLDRISTEPPPTIN
jgi:hypothetical protein